MMNIAIIAMFKFKVEIIIEYDFKSSGFDKIVDSDSCKIILLCFNFYVMLVFYPKIVHV